MTNCKLAILPVLIALFVVPFAAHAFAVRSGDAVYIPEDETVEGSLYAAGAYITIDGRVTGDVFCAGQSIKISGLVDGDIICVGSNIVIDGAVGGSVRVAGSDVDIRADIERGLTAGGTNVEVGKDAVIGWDALIGGFTARMGGEIGRSLLGFGANFILSGDIGQDAVLYVEKDKRSKSPALTVADSASIGGKLDYTSGSDASISQKAQIKGKVTHNFPPVGARAKPKTSLFAGIFPVALLSALVVGLVLASIWRKPMIVIADSMLERFWPTLGWGAVWTIITPIIAIMLAFTIIGFRLTLMAIWSWLILLMVSKVVASIAIGRLLLGRIWIAKKDALGWIVAVGVILSWIVFYIPVIGWFVSLMAMWWGAGAIILYLKKNYDAGKIEVK